MYITSLSKDGCEYYLTVSFSGTQMVLCILKLRNFIIIIIIITSTSDLQPSTPTVNQLPGQLVSTEIRTMHKNKF